MHRIYLIIHIDNGTMRLSKVNDNVSKFELKQDIITVMGMCCRQYGVGNITWVVFLRYAVNYHET